MNTRFARVVPLAVLAACATRIDPRTDFAPLPSEAAAPAIGGDRPAQDPERPPTPQPDASYLDEQDYRPRTLYLDAHGDFIAKMKRFEPTIRGSFTWLPEGSIKGDPGDFDQGWVRSDARIPFISGTETAIVAGGYFDVRHFNPDSTFGLPNQTAYAVGVNIGVNQFLTDDLMLSGIWSPGVYSDLDGTLTHKDWQFNGEVLATYRAHDTLFFKGGAIHSRDFKDIDAFPVFGLSWLFHPRWRFDLLAPKNVEFSWNPTPAIILHAGVDLEGNRYRVRAPVSAGKTAADLWAQEITVTGGAIYRFNDYFSIFARSGTTIAGDYKFGPFGSSQNGTLEATFLLEGGIGIDF
jgi:hypothetical protein